jgi:hypothetical protein
MSFLKKQSQLKKQAEALGAKPRPWKDWIRSSTRNQTLVKSFREGFKSVAKQSKASVKKLEEASKKIERTIMRIQPKTEYVIVTLTAELTHMKTGAKYTYSLSDYAKIKYTSDKSRQKQIDQITMKLMNEFETKEGFGYYLIAFKETKTQSVSADVFKNLPTKIDFVRIKKVMSADYAEIPADNYSTLVDGYCVDEFLSKTYRDQIPRLYNKGSIDEIIGVTNDGDGRTISDIDKFCEKYNISHYALDVDSQLCFKKIRTTKNYKALIYYIIDCHIYPVEDQSQRQRIIKFASKDNVKVIDNLYKFECKPKDYNADEFIEDVPIEKLDGYNNCDIYYHLSNLEDMFIQLFKKDNKQYKYQSSGGRIVTITYKNDVVLHANANHNFSLDWKDSKKLCEMFKIEFKNQSIVSIASEIYESKYNVMNDRMFLTPSIRRSIINRQKGKCNMCKDKVDKFDIDHIQPLSCGGTNEMINLQALCQVCHKEKTAKECADRIFKIDNTLSCFTTETQKIFTDSKNAFVHKFEKDEGFDLDHP